jgi:hypothetical protein
MYISSFSSNSIFKVFYGNEIIKKIYLSDIKYFSEDTTIFKEEEKKIIENYLPYFKENSINQKIISFFYKNLVQIKLNNYIYYIKDIEKDKNNFNGVFLFHNHNNNSKLIGHCINNPKNNTIVSTFIQEEYRKYRIGTLIRAIVIHSMFKNTNNVGSCTTPESLLWHLKQPGSEILYNEGQNFYLITITKKTKFYENLNKIYKDLNIYEKIPQNIFNEIIIKKINDNYNNKRNKE